MGAETGYGGYGSEWYGMGVETVWGLGEILVVLRGGLGGSVVEPAPATVLVRLGCAGGDLCGLTYMVYRRRWCASD